MGASPDGLVTDPSEETSTMGWFKSSVPPVLRRHHFVRSQHSACDVPRDWS